MKSMNCDAHRLLKKTEKEKMIESNRKPIQNLRIYREARKANRSNDNEKSPIKHWGDLHRRICW